MQKTFYPKIFWELLKTDIIIYKDTIFSTMIDATCWFSSTIVLYAYVFPAVGMRNEFGTFIAISSIASCAYWDIWSTSIMFVSDMQGNKTISYFLTLPLPNYLIFVKQIIGYAIKSAITSLIIIPLGKLFLWNRLIFANFSLPKFAIIYILLNIFVGTFALFITSLIKDMQQISKVGIRFLFPLWSFSSAFYPWKLLLSMHKPLAYLNLANPVLYMMEGTRSAILGPTGYINFWICVAALIGYSMLFGYLGIMRLKKRLDFV